MWDPHELAHVLIDTPKKAMDVYFDKYVEKAKGGGVFTDEQAIVIASMVNEVAQAAATFSTMTTLTALTKIDPSTQRRVTQLLQEMFAVQQNHLMAWGLIPDPRDN